MALNANALITVKEFFDYLKEPTPISSDANYILVEQLINRASQYVEDYTNGSIIDITITEKLDGNNSNELLLSTFPIQDILAIAIDGVNVLDDSAFYNYGEVYLTNGFFPIGKQNVTVTYVTGYGANMDSIPHSIKQAALLFVQYWFKRDSLDYSTTFGESEIIENEWRFPAMANQLLDKYRRIKTGFINGKKGNSWQE